MTRTEQLEESRSNRVDRSRIMGEYYRELSANYLRCEQTCRWPMPPGQTYSETIHAESLKALETPEPKDDF